MADVNRTARREPVTSLCETGCVSTRILSISLTLIFVVLATRVITTTAISAAESDLQRENDKTILNPSCDAHEPAAPVPVVVTSLDGTKSSGLLKSWTANQLILGTDSVERMDPVELRSIDFERPAKRIRGGESMVWLSNGDRIGAKTLTVANDVVKISWPVLGDLNPPSIPLEKVVAVILELPATTSEQIRLFADIETLSPGSDVVLLDNGDRSAGEFERLDATFIQLKSPISLLKLDRSRVRAVRMNPELTNVVRTTGRRTILTLTDGSRITATAIELDDKTLELKVKSPSMGMVLLPLTAIRTCQLFGDRAIPITDYEPVKVEFTPYLSNEWSLARNTNVLRGPLRLRENEFSTGLGMHSRMSVTYELLGSERTFQSTVGIDDAANGAGSAVFTVEVDGRRVWTSPELTGKSAVTQTPAIDLQGSKRLTLSVDFGDFADVSDYADWCDPILIFDRNK